MGSVLIKRLLTFLFEVLREDNSLISDYYYYYYLLGQDFNKHTTIQETNICLLLKSYDT